VIRQGKIRNVHRSVYSRAPLTSTSLTLTGLGLNPGLRVDRPDTRLQKHEIKSKRVRITNVDWEGSATVDQERSLLLAVVTGKAKL
jgi:hypothetical protein